VDLGNGGSLDRRQLVSAWSLRTMSKRQTHMIDQLLSPILDLIISVKQMYVFLDDPLRVLPSESSAATSFWANEDTLP
jgi:hypothetical protein